MELQNARSIEPIDYLIIGHITQDNNDQQHSIGGTATYAALMAKALGLQPGIVSAHAADLDVSLLTGIPVLRVPSDQSTAFTNHYQGGRRTQMLTTLAEPLALTDIPETWRGTPIIHLGPVAQEVDPMLIRHLEAPFVGVTPQGWFREWDHAGRVAFREWPEAAFALERANAVVLSIEDVHNQHEIIDELAAAVKVLALTEGHDGARLYWNGDIKGYRADQYPHTDATGAGDVFAACFFWRYYNTKDPWEAARFATKTASLFVSRPGFTGIPTPDEISANLIEVIRSY